MRRGFGSRQRLVFLSLGLAGTGPSSGASVAERVAFEGSEPFHPRALRLVTGGQPPAALQESQFNPARLSPAMQGRAPDSSFRVQVRVHALCTGAWTRTLAAFPGQGGGAGWGGRAWRRRRPAPRATARAPSRCRSAAAPATGPLPGPALPALRLELFACTFTVSCTLAEARRSHARARTRSPVPPSTGPDRALRRRALLQCR